MNPSELPDFRGTFTGQIKAGQFVPSEPGRWAGWLMKHNGKQVTMIVSRVKHRRSDVANRRYWGLIVPLFSEWTGYEKNEAHEVLLQMFSKTEVELPNGLRAERIIRSSTMTTEEFYSFTSSVERFLIVECHFELPE